MSLDELTQNKPAEDADEAISKFLLFHLGDELYATPLLKVREVIKMTTIKPVPYMVQHFLGVINLRGQIVGIVDLRSKFQLKAADSRKGMILIVETAFGPLGAIVDEVEAVEKISPSEIDANPIVETKIPTEFFAGIAKLERGLVNLIDIAGCLSSEELRKIRAAA